MSALDDIKAALCATPSPPLGSGTRRFILIGKEAMRAVRCDVEDHRKPAAIGGFSVLETDAFPGWEIVDRPVPEKAGRVLKRLSEWHG